MHDVIVDLLGRMTLQEKVSLLAGSDTWHTTAIERLGIPQLKMTDGPNGARGGGNFTDGVKGACFPEGNLLAFTGNTEMVRRFRQAVGQEGKTKRAPGGVAPAVNIQP